ncbi:MAG: hypothetical protein HY553_01965 [Elusimicrobia bacterium]|nr:hypothetical protein [Elusimicrobiota bacterium]
MTRSSALVLALACGVVGYAVGVRRGAPPAEAAESFRGIELSNADGTAAVNLGACPTKRCFVSYVAPWCGYCRAATPLIKELRVALRKQGMESWVIIGMDQEPALKEYARDFGAGTLLDTRELIKPRGVPHFFVIDDAGTVLRKIAGLPPNPQDLVAFAAKD